MSDAMQVPRQRSRFGPYDLRRVLGRGGMADVYEAEDTRNRRIVALKLWPPVFSQDLVFCARLQRQARIVGQLNEPHIVPIHDCGEIDGLQFLDMQFIKGTDLSQLLKRLGRLTAQRAVDIVRHIASALDAAHAVGVLHGDVKPTNILVAAADESAYLVDFGISDASPHKGVARVIGSTSENWKYTAPERFTTPAVDHRVDIYGLACVLHECLTGSPPYWADNPGELVSAHLLSPIPRPSHVQPDISAALDAVIARGMAKDPTERYAVVGDLALAACEALTAPHHGHTIDACKPGPDARASRAEREPSPARAASSTASATLHPPANWPYRRPDVAESRSQHSSPAESTHTPSPLPSFGPDERSRPGELAMPPSPPTTLWAGPDQLRRRRVPRAAVSIALIVVCFVAIWLLRPSHPTSTTISGTTSTRPSMSGPSPSPGEVQARLFSLLPRDYPAGACRPVTAPKEASSELSCDKNSDPDGPLSATYELLADTTSLHGTFDRIVQGSTIIECPGRIQSPGPWHRNATPDKTSGVLFCGIQNGNPLLGWTDDAELLISVANGGPQGPTINQLYAWWTSHS